VYIRGHKDKLIKCRALLDTCATENLISEALIKRLGVEDDVFIGIRRNQRHDYGIEKYGRDYNTIDTW